MANNTTIAAQTGGDVIRDIDKGGVKTAVSIIDVGGSGAEVLLSGSNPMPVSGTVTVGAGSAAIGSVTVTGLPALPAGSNAIGTVTANIGTSGSLALDATLTGGTQKTKLVDSGGTNVATVSAAGAVKVDGSAVTQPVSAAALPLPAGAATSAKQPALGTAGSASADVLTVQGAASMTALKVDASATTQPVSGAVTANAGTNLNTSLLALESGGNLATLAGAVSSGKVQTARPDPAAGTGTITAADAASTTTVQGLGQSYVTGTPTAGSSVSLAISGETSLVVQLTGTWVGTLALEKSYDGGTTWMSMAGHVAAQAPVSSVTANSIITCVVGAATNARVRCTAYTSGTATVRLQPGYGEAIVGSAIAYGSNQVGSVAPQFGTIYSGTTSVPIQTAAISAALSGNNTIVAGVTGKKIYVLGAWFIPAGAVTATWKDSGGASLTGGFSLLANQPFSRATDVFAPQFVAGTGNDLVLNLNVAGQCSGVVVYVVF